MAYIGRQLVRGQNRVLDDISSSFNGSTTAFNLTVSSSSSPPASVNQLWIILGGVLQKPGTDFTVADAVLTFTTAPASTLSFWGMIQGDTSDINAPADASVTPSKIANSGDFAFPADVRFKDADGSHYVGLQAPSTVSSNLVWTLPAADGSANQLLKTDGSGALGWASDTQSNLLDEDNMSSNSATQPASQQSIKAYADTKTVLTTSTDNTICTVTGANSIQGEANLNFNGTTLTIGSNGSAFAENNVKFQSAGTAYIDHATTGQDIQIRVSTSSSNDTTGPTFKSNGNLAFASGKGIDFSATSDATGMSSELLDDYEEGLVTATCSNSVTLHSDANALSYTKVGRLVTLMGQVRVNSDNSDAHFIINNLPFTAANTTDASAHSVAACRIYSWDVGVTGQINVIATVFDAGTTLLFQVNRDGQATVVLPASAGGYIGFSITYIAA